MAKEKNKDASCRLGRVGGQAVLEGVMMKAGQNTVTTCRKEDGTLVVNDAKFTSVRKKFKLLNIPILRGVVNFIEMMILSVKTLNASADALGLEDEDSKAEKWMRKHLGIGITDIIMVIGVILGIALALVLFIYLPTIAANGIDLLYTTLSGDKSGISPNLIAVIEGVMKVVIFLTYLALVALMPDIKRTFMYHGAEHKSIACFEAGEELTPENAKRYRRFHPRCGTSFMFLMILLGIFAGMFIRNVFPNLPAIAYTGMKLALLPLVMGIGYEILMLMGKHDNIVTRIVSAPGLWVQRLTTKEPTDDMLEVAIVSLKCSLRDEFPEFDEYFKARPWEADGGETIIDGKKQGAEEKPDEEKPGEAAEIAASEQEIGAEISEVAASEQEISAEAIKAAAEAEEAAAAPKAEESTEKSATEAESVTDASTEAEASEPAAQSK